MSTITAKPIYQIPVIKVEAELNRLEAQILKELLHYVRKTHTLGQIGKELCDRFIVSITYALEAAKKGGE